jgi:hypothetical protein
MPHAEDEDATQPTTLRSLEMKKTVSIIPDELFSMKEAKDGLAVNGEFSSSMNL